MVSPLSFTHYIHLADIFVQSIHSLLTQAHFDTYTGGAGEQNTNPTAHTWPNSTISNAGDRF